MLVIMLKSLVDPRKCTDSSWAQSDFVREKYPENCSLCRFPAVVPICILNYKDPQYYSLVVVVPSAPFIF
jgi:hypothetical protein